MAVCCNLIFIYQRTKENSKEVIRLELSIYEHSESNGSE